MRSRSERAKVSSLNEQLYAMGYKIPMLVTFYKVYAKSQVWEKSVCENSEACNQNSCCLSVALIWSHHSIWILGCRTCIARWLIWIQNGSSLCQIYTRF